MSIQSEVSRLQSAKASLAAAIEAKGVSVPETTKLDGYSDLVEQIQPGEGGGSIELCELNFSASFVDSFEFIIVTYDDLPDYGGTLNAEQFDTSDRDFSYFSKVITNVVKGSAVRVKYNGMMVNVSGEGVEFVGTLDGYSLYKILDNTASLYVTGIAGP